MCFDFCTPKPSQSEAHNLYYTGVGTTLAGLMDKSPAELQVRTRNRTNPRLAMNLFQMAAFYWDVGYNYGTAHFETFSTRDDLKAHLRDRFKEHLSKKPSLSKKNLKMKLAAGFMGKRVREGKDWRQEGHMVALKVWYEHGQITYETVDYQFNGENKKCIHTSTSLPQDSQVAYFVCFSPIFY